MWKRNRNLHTIALLDCVINNKLEEPYNKFAPDSPIPLVSKILIKSKLSKKFEEEIIKDVVAKSNHFLNYQNKNSIEYKPSEKLLLSKSNKIYDKRNLRLEK